MGKLLNLDKPGRWKALTLFFQMRKQTQISPMTSPGDGAKLEFLFDFLTSNAQMWGVLQLLVRYFFFFFFLDTSLE